MDKSGIDDFLAGGALAANPWAMDDLSSLPTLKEMARALYTEENIPVTDRDRALDWWKTTGQFDTRRITQEDSWNYFDGTRWLSYGSKDTGLHISIINYLSALADRVNDLLKESSSSKRKPLREVQNSLESSYTSEQVARWAKKLSDLYVPAGYFDPAGESSYLFNCANGTLDLRTLQFADHNPDNRLTGKSPTAYDPEALAPDWVRFMREILPSKEVRRYVQRVLGMSLIADPGVQGAFVFHGQGANGKGAMMRVVSRVLGLDYATMVPRNTIQKSRREEHPTQFLEFRSRRLAWLDEFPASASFSEHDVKELTGGGDIKARGMRQDFVQFRPTHTLFVTTNNLPEVSNDYAMWRRLHLIPFKVEIPVELRDENREVRILRDEASGVLNWLVAGFQDFWERSDRGAGPGRIDDPEEVSLATQDWQMSQDHVAQFMASFVTPKQGDAVQITDLRSAYVQWVQAQDVPFGMRLNQNNFTPELQRRNFDVRKDYVFNGNKRTWLLDHIVTKDMNNVTSIRRVPEVHSGQTSEQAF